MWTGLRGKFLHYRILFKSHETLSRLGQFQIQQIHPCRGFCLCGVCMFGDTISKITYASVYNWLPLMLYLPKMPQRWAEKCSIASKLITTRANTPKQEFKHLQGYKKYASRISRCVSKTFYKTPWELASQDPTKLAMQKRPVCLRYPSDLSGREVQGMTSIAWCFGWERCAFMDFSHHSMDIPMLYRRLPKPVGWPWEFSPVCLPGSQSPS